MFLFVAGRGQDDMKHFHGTYKKVCDKHDKEYYAKFKKVRADPLNHFVA